MADKKSAKKSTYSIDTPQQPRLRWWPRMRPRSDAFGRVSETFARFMGTPAFLVGMTIFCAVWLAWNTFLPESMQFDPRALNFTLLTLILSLQASYAAPLLLLAQNRQDDRDRVQAEQDRQRNERNHATTDYITREIAVLRLALSEVATRDFVRSELRDLVSDLDTADQENMREAWREDFQQLRQELIAELRAELAQEMRRELRIENQLIDQPSSEHASSRSASQAPPPLHTDQEPHPTAPSTVSAATTDHNQGMTP
ncbi:DUF1003 domain-containing protein [Devriesea agamarum]|uniref:DUF1003 domain-containing protein n=1 Tax=Devriesea agamarum TaxID=472569 RepID=UPI000A053D04|nr:DUF1003 domain-containing protein [Devriesea agamarum]